jgi:hypothetical protein
MGWSPVFLINARFQGCLLTAQTPERLRACRRGGSKMGFSERPAMTLAMKSVLGVLLSATVSGQALACYTVYNRANQVIYHAAAAPVDMRYQLHQTLPAVFPGGHMVFAITDTSCPSVDSRRGANVNRAVNALMERNAYISDLSMARGNTVTVQPLRP